MALDPSCQTHGIHSTKSLMCTCLRAFRRLTCSLARMAAWDFALSCGCTFFRRKVNGHTWSASFLAVPPVLLAADSVASTVVVDQPSVGVRKVDPNLVVAALVSGSNAENIAIDFARAETAYLPLIVCIRWLDESTYVGPFAWNVSWSPQSGRAMRNWQARVGKRFLDSAVVPLFVIPDRRHHAAPLKSQATMSTCS